VRACLTRCGPRRRNRFWSFPDVEDRRAGPFTIRTKYCVGSAVELSIIYGVFRIYIEKKRYMLEA
jgi:hypothetical protein